MLERLSLRDWLLVVFMLITLGVYTYYTFLPRIPENTCVTDVDCVRRPCCHMCNTIAYADYLVESKNYECRPILCAKPYECTCLEGRCILIELG
jgi:hypothetical protein